MASEEIGLVIFPHLPIFNATSDANDESPCKLLIRLWLIFNIWSRVLEKISNGRALRSKGKGREERSSSNKRKICRVKMKVGMDHSRLVRTSGSRPLELRTYTAR